MTNNGPAPLALYVHVPFCASKCPYCDFYSGRFGEERKEDFIAAVTEELSSLRRSRPFADEAVFTRPLSSVYFGGGTPSILTVGQFSRLMAAVKRRFTILPDAEVTVEVNPSRSSPGSYFYALALEGVNRVSLGMQSAVDEERRRLGRRAGREEIARCVQEAREAGIGNISLDIMLGIPEQTKESLKETLDFALSQDVPHLSAYLLSIEEGTPFAKKRDKLDLPDEDTSADFYLETCRTLEDNGYRHYEVSNFCREGLIGRHNMTYWLGGEYLGVGPGAHSFLGRTRFFQPPSLNGFLAGAPAQFEGEGGDDEEKLLLRLRTDLGAPVAALKNKEETIRSLCSRGLVTVEEGTLRLTHEGFLLSNAVIGALL